MSLRIYGQTSGYIELDSPAIGNSASVVLPTTSGTLATESFANTAGGLVYITGTTFSAASSVNVNNCFTSTYNNYRIIYDSSGASTGLTVSMRLRVSGADNSTSNYTRQNLSAQSTTVAASQVLNGAQWGLQTTDATYGTYNRFSYDIFGPLLTRVTTMSTCTMFTSTTPQYFANVDAYLFNATTSFDGFSLITNTGTISGTVRIYGYRNS